MDIIRCQSHDEWLKIRRSGIGGSDIAAVMGLNPYMGPVDVYLDKTGQSDDQPDSEAMFWGRVKEDLVAKVFSERTGMRIQRVNATLRRGVRIANIDRAIINQDMAKAVRPLEKPDGFGRYLTTDSILECKTADSRNAYRWGKSQLDEIRADNVTTPAEIPMEYMAQVQWYMGVTGASTAYVAVLIGAHDFRVYMVGRDNAVIDGMVKLCDRFWNDHVSMRVAPAPKTAAEAMHVWRSDDGQAVEADGDAATTLSQLMDLKEKAKEIADDISAKEQALKLFMGGKQSLTVNGDVIATWKSQVRRTLDSKRLKYEKPALYMEYTKESASRVFRIKA